MSLAPFNGSYSNVASGYLSSSMLYHPGHLTGESFCTVEEDGIVQVHPKSLGYVIGEQIVNPLFKMLANAFSSVNRFLTFPGAEGAVVPLNRVEMVNMLGNNIATIDKQLVVAGTMSDSIERTKVIDNMGTTQYFRSRVETEMLGFANQYNGFLDKINGYCISVEKIKLQMESLVQDLKNGDKSSYYPNKGAKVELRLPEFDVDNFTVKEVGRIFLNDIQQTQGDRSWDIGWCGGDSVDLRDKLIKDFTDGYKILYEQLKVRDITTEVAVREEYSDAMIGIHAQGCSIWEARAKDSLQKKMKEIATIIVQDAKKKVRDQILSSVITFREEQKKLAKGIEQTNNGIEPHVNDYSWDINQPGRVYGKTCLFSFRTIGEIDS